MCVHVSVRAVSHNQWYLPNRIKMKKIEILMDGSISPGG